MVVTSSFRAAINDLEEIVMGRQIPVSIQIIPPLDFLFNWGVCTEGGYDRNRNTIYISEQTRTPLSIISHELGHAMGPWYWTSRTEETKAKLFEFHCEDEILRAGADHEVKPRNRPNVTERYQRSHAEAFDRAMELYDRNGANALQALKELRRAHFYEMVPFSTIATRICGMPKLY